LFSKIWKLIEFVRKLWSLSCATLNFSIKTCYLLCRSFFQKL
jgi:hypothetical protein